MNLIMETLEGYLYGGNTASRAAFSMYLAVKCDCWAWLKSQNDGCNVVIRYPLFHYPIPLHLIAGFMRP